MTAEEYLERTAEEIKGIIRQFERATAQSRPFQGPALLGLDIIGRRSPAVENSYGDRWLREITGEVLSGQRPPLTVAEWYSRPYRGLALYEEHSWIGDDGQFNRFWDIYFPCAEVSVRPRLDHTWIPALNLYHSGTQDPPETLEDSRRRRDVLVQWLEDRRARSRDGRVDIADIRFQVTMGVSILTIWGLFPSELERWPIDQLSGLWIPEVAALPMEGEWSIFEWGGGLMIELMPASSRGSVILAWLAERGGRLLPTGRLEGMARGKDVYWWRAVPDHLGPGTSGKPPQQVVIIADDYRYFTRLEGEEARMGTREAQELARQIAAGTVIRPGVVIQQGRDRSYVITV